MELAPTLRVLRRRAMWPQEELAERSGVSVSTIAGIESGRVARPRKVSSRMLSDDLGLSNQQRGSLVAAARSEPVADVLIEDAPAHTARIDFNPG